MQTINSDGVVFDNSVSIHRQNAITEENQIITFGDAWKLYREKWLPNIARADNEESRYNRHITPIFSNVPLADIKPLDLESFKQMLLSDKKLSPKTTHHVLCLVRAVYNRLSEWEVYTGSIPTNSIKMPKVDNARIRYLSKDEANNLLTELKKRSLIWYLMALISINSGLRLGEILALTYGNLDLENNAIHVLDAKSGTRITQINEILKNMFLEMIQMPNVDSANLIFPSKNGTPIKATNVSKTFSKTVDHLRFNDNVTDIRYMVVFHTLRHTFASWLAIEGVPLYTISQLMGHKSLSMTMRYAHLCPDSKRNAVAKFIKYS